MMITQYEVHSLLHDQIPELNIDAYPLRAPLEIYVLINSFADYTKKAIEQQDFYKAKKCLILAEDLYLNGDKMVRLLIENSFVYTFSSFMDRSRIELFRMKFILPDTLYKIYRKQVLDQC